MSRTRLVRPEFFSDERMARLSAWTRLVYIGLWTVSDDAGYFEGPPAEIAAELFRHDRKATRDRRVEAALLLLEAEGRIRWLECERHGIVPTLPEYGVISGGNHSYTHRAKHEKKCLPTLFGSRQAPFTRGRLSTSTDVSRTSHVSGSVSESESESESGRPAGRDSANPLKEAALAVGGFAGRLAGAKS